MTADFTVRPLDESTWPAFAYLAEHSDGFPSGCWCMGFHPEGVGKHTTAAQNRERKRTRVLEGTTHAALVFDRDTCVGWCQFGSPEELPRIKNRAAYERARLRARPIGGLHAVTQPGAIVAAESRLRRWLEHSI